MIPRTAPLAVTAAIVALSGCAARTGRAPLPPLVRPAADSIHHRVVRPGVELHRWWIARGPWAIQVLDVDRAACWAPIAVKGVPRVVGRLPTTALADSAALRAGVRDVAGAVNADFFSFAPPGIPQSAHVEQGEMFASPTAGRLVFFVDDTGGVAIGDVAFDARIDGVAIDAWNRPLSNGVAVLDDRFGGTTDTASSRLEIIARRVSASRPTSRTSTLLDAAVVERVDTAVAGIEVASGRLAIIVGARTDSARRARFARYHPGDSVIITATVGPPLPREAVGGFGRLVRQGRVDPAVDNTGSPGFRGRHPRTAVAIAAGGRRLLLVTVDGRQDGYSAGMTLSELADLMIQLGATDALNLDGGGSTTMVVRDSAGTRFEVVNRPSDRDGERPVGNALAIVKPGTCGTQ